MSISRRRFLKVMGAGATAVSVSPLTSKILKDFAADATEKSREKMIYTTCGICGSSCAIKAYVEDGILRKLEGNPEDQQSGGKLCGKGNAGVSLLYDPDRLKFPMKRTNPEKGWGIDPKWKRITWEEAFDTIAQKIKEGTTGEGKSGRNFMWIGHHKAKDLLKALNSPNDVCHHSTCNTARVVADKAVAGGSFFPDFEKTDYILAFGWDMPSKAKNAFARPYMDAVDRGVKTVIFDPRLSITAAKGEWIPVKPGSDLAVVLAMINYIIQEDLYDKEYIEAYTTGFDQLVEAVKGYTPEWAEGISEVPASTIKRIATEFATAKSACLPHYKRGAHQIRREGLNLVHAENILVAITGNIEKRGGMLFPRKPKLGKKKPKVQPPKLTNIERIDNGEEFLSLSKPLKGHGVYQVVPDNVLNKYPYPINAAIVYKQSLMSFPDTKKAARAIASIPFVVNINIYPDEMAMLSDIVLPEMTFLEKGGIKPRKLTALYPQVSVVQPVVKPMYDTKSLGKIKKEVAKRLGLKDYLASGSKDKILEPMGITYSELKKTGVYAKKTLFKSKLNKMKTESKKIELAPSLFLKKGYQCLPTYFDACVLKPEKEYPLYFTTTRSPLNRHAYTENIPWINEIVPENRAWLNSETAKKYSIKENDEIIVESKTGKIKLKAFVTERIRPDTVCIPHGYGRWSKYLTKVYNKGGNDGELMHARNIEEMRAINDPSASASDCEIMVKIQKA